MFESALRGHPHAPVRHNGHRLLHHGTFRDFRSPVGILTLKFECRWSYQLNTSPYGVLVFLSGNPRSAPCFSRIENMDFDVLAHRVRIYGFIPPSVGLFSKLDLFSAGIFFPKDNWRRGRVPGVFSHEAIWLTNRARRIAPLRARSHRGPRGVLRGRFRPSRAARYGYTHFISAGLRTTVGIVRPGNPGREPLVIIEPDNGTLDVADVVIVACIIGISINSDSDAGSILVACIIAISINSDSDSANSNSNSHSETDTHGLADGASHGLSHAYQRTDRAVERDDGAVSPARRRWSNDAVRQL